MALGVVAGLIWKSTDGTTAFGYLAVLLVGLFSTPVGWLFWASAIGYIWLHMRLKSSHRGSLFEVLARVFHVSDHLDGRGPCWVRRSAWACWWPGGGAGCASPGPGWLGWAGPRVRGTRPAGW